MGKIISIDQGTTGTTAVLIDSEEFHLIDKVNEEFPQIFPKPGWVEHDLKDIWRTVKSTVSQLLHKHNVQGQEIVCIGITNQRETTCAFHSDGTPLYHAIVWQDRRTDDFCQQLKNQGKEKLVQSKTGLPVDPYFSATKMRWLLENSEKVQQCCHDGHLKFGTIDSFLLYLLTGCQVHATEATNASRTLLMNLQNCEWDEELLALFQIPLSTLPTIANSFGLFGTTKGLDFLPDGIPVTGILGDQQAALFGQAGLDKGDIKCTYGTGAFMLLNSGTELARSENGLLSTVAYQCDGQAVYSLEGSCYIAGAAVQWLRDNLGIIESSPEVEALAGQVESLEEMEHILFMPFFTGIGSPHWVSEAKAALVGLTRGSRNEHIARACLEGIVFSINDLIQSMQKDTGISLSQLNVDGGAVANGLLMDMQSTVSNLEIIRPEIIETTAYGAGLAAGVGKGLIGLEDVKSLWRKEKSFVGLDAEREYFSTKQEYWLRLIKQFYAV